MFIQIALGTALILLTVLGTGLSFFLLEKLFAKVNDWLLREPHQPKLMMMLSVTVLWVLGTVTISVWVWALVLWGLGVFLTLEGSMYFSLTAFTTLGFGDILLPHRWRLLGGMAAVNGLINLGLSTAMLVEMLRFVRVSQREAAEKNQS
ncbi:MAG: ion channel [Paracoccaceae bacterium]|nr:ion channel [Paracoccaceae bacterium]